MWIRKCTLTSFIALGMMSKKKKPLQMENQQLVSPSRQCTSTPAGFDQGFLTKQHCDNTGTSPLLSWLGSSWFLPVPSTEISIEVKAISWFFWLTYEWDGKAEKAFTKWIPEMLQTPLQSLAEVHSCIRGLFWRKCILNDVFHISQKYSESGKILKLPQGKFPVCM